MLPSGERLVEPFCGGAAVSHYGLMMGKWGKSLLNDADVRVSDWIKRVLGGEYSGPLDDYDWLERDDFERLKGGDAGIAHIWSYSNNCDDYLYGYAQMDYQKKLHNVVQYNVWDDEVMTRLGLNEVEGGTAEGRLAWLTAKFGSDAVRCEEFNRYNRVKTFGGDISGRVESVTGVDYRECEYRAGDIVYCDPPYENTTGYFEGVFDSKAFYEWVKSRTFPVYFSSYEISDPDMFVIGARMKRNQARGGRESHSTYKSEVLYGNEAAREAVASGMCGDLLSMSMAKGVDKGVFWL